MRFAQFTLTGCNVCGEWAVPLYASRHRALHTVGDEKKWWKAQGIDSIAHAERLWRETRGQEVPLIYEGKRATPA